MARSAIAAVLGSLTPSAALLAWRADQSQDLRQLKLYSFSDFVREYGRAYERGSEEWAARERAFNASRDDIVAFQSVSERTWSKGVTRFMDYTTAEWRSVLGYRGRGASRTAPPSRSVKLFRTDPDAVLPKKVMLSTGADSLLSIVRDQGMCGSCWAEAATSVLEGQMEQNATALARLMQVLNGTQKYATLSSQTMVSCTPNPRHCGGTGGCQGATAELGYDMIKENGMPLAVEWPYSSGYGQTPACKNAVFNTVRLGITGYTVLPSNKLNPLKEALYKTGGPIAIAVDATSWSFYRGGIYSDGKGDFEVNHAVTLMGYKSLQEGSLGYWWIKNSWGSYWGEDGFIRLEMKDDEESHCGWSHHAHDGLACDGDPDTAWVCGTCGILYDSVFPTGVHVIEA